MADRWHVITLPPKKCLHCKATFEHARGVRPSRFRAQVYCSPSCTTEAMIDRRRKKSSVPAHDRLWKYVDKSPGHGPKGDCWVWMAHRNKDGYGRIGISFPRGATELAHRVSYRAAFGDFPSSLLVRHKCDNPAYVRPCHLELGTQQDNSNDNVERGRQRAARGEAGGSCRLTEAQARAIHDDTRPETVIATEYGISRGAVWHIRNERNWKHLWRDKAGER